jgi:hypothetical protein
MGTAAAKKNPGAKGAGKEGRKKRARCEADAWAPELVSLLEQVTAGAPVNLGSCVAVPLLLPKRKKLGAVLLEEALDRGVTTLEELSEEGRVPFLRVKHRGYDPLLLVDGEQVLGGKQNRIFNTSMLVLPGVVAEVPVSCVEAGRWEQSRADFVSAGSTLHTSARARKLASVAEEVASTGMYDADQGQVWDDVAEFLGESDAHNATLAYEVGVAKRAKEQEHLIEQLEPQRGQVGVAVVRGRRLLCLDLFGSPGLYARAWKKIARGILTGAVPMPVNCPGAPTTVKKSLQRVLEARGKRQIPAPGCGETLHGRTRSLVVGAVAHEGAVYHAAVASV